MKYEQPTFSLPVGSNKVTQEEWDRIFGDDTACTCDEAYTVDCEHCFYCGKAL